MSEPTRAYASLRELLNRPGILEPPCAVIPWLAWPERITLLAGREKCGKSTLLSQGVAAVTRGADFLDTETEPATVFWFALDEPEGDLVRRLVHYGADPDRVFIQNRRLLGGADDFAALLKSTGARVMVVDSLAKLASGVVLKGGDAMAWTPLLDMLRQITQNTKAAIVLIHHATKQGGYRDSTAIGGEADAILEFAPHEKGETRRHVAYEGRVGLRDFDLEYLKSDGRYVLNLPEDDAVSAATLHDSSRKLLQVLADAEPEGLTSAKWERHAGLPGTTFNRARRQLCRDGLCLTPEHTRTRRYRITNKGETALVPRQYQGDAMVVPLLPHAREPHVAGTTGWHQQGGTSGDPRSPRPSTPEAA